MIYWLLIDYICEYWSLFNQQFGFIPSYLYKVLTSSTFISLSLSKNLNSSKPKHTIICTFSSNNSSAILEVLKEEGGGMVMKIDNWAKCYGAV